MSVESQEASAQLLKNKYSLHNSPEVDRAVERTFLRTGEKVPQDPLGRIQNYLNRFHDILGHGGNARFEHNLDLVKARFHDRYIIKPSEIPESYWDNQRRIIRERGQGGDLAYIDWEELKRQNTEAVIADQTSSLNHWINYLSSQDAPYPDSLKYWTLRSVLGMAEFDKERKQYPQRSKGTTKPFPDLNREALSYVIDAVDKKYKGESGDLSSDEEDSKEFEKLLKAESFPKLYAWAIEKVTPASESELAEAQGEWIKYDQNSDHMPLVQSLQGHGTGWCTAGESTAEIQLRGGDFYVYYSYSNDRKPTIPRAAIRMEGDKIGEVRGIAKDQNLDGGVVDVVDEKLRQFPDGDLYKKRVSDMEYLTQIENKVSNEEHLTREDIVFLYEIDSFIEGFGYDRDPRIDEIRSQRSPEVDMLIIFDCEPEQIAHNVQEINDNTKAFVGPLTSGIFDQLKKYHIEQVYTKFPEGKIRFDQVEIGGKSKEELKEELRNNKINISDYAESMMDNPDFVVLPEAKVLETVKISVKDLGFSGMTTIEQIYQKAKELGLELCPAEVGSRLRLKDKEQQIGDWYFIAMNQITGSNSYPHVFRLERGGGGLWLDGHWTDPDSRWPSGNHFVFSLRKEIL